MSRSASPAADFLPFAKLTQKNIPPRVRSLLEGLYQTAWPTLEEGVGKALDDLDRDLFAQAERVMNSNEQQRFLESNRELRKQRGAFTLACRDAVQRTLLCLVDPSIEEVTLTSQKRGVGKDQLSLVDTAELEQQLALSEIAARAEIRASNALQALSYRLAVIVGRAPMDMDAMALGPNKICAAIAEGARKFEIPVLHRIALFRRIDKAIFRDPVGLYNALNGFLVEHRVFPNLHLGARTPAHRVQPPEHVATAESSAETRLPAQSEAVEQGPARAARMGDAPAASGHSTPASAAKFDPVDGALGQAPDDATPAEPAIGMGTAAVAGADHALAEPALSATASYDSPAARAFQQIIDADAKGQTSPRPAQAPSSPAADAQFFDTLRELLAGRRGPANAAEAAALQARPVAEVQDVQSVLSVLQSQAPAPVMVDGRWVTRTSSHIKRDLMSQLRGLNGGTAPRLREEDSDTIDLVGMLFDHLLAEHRPNSTSHGLLSKLQVPLMKVALGDKSFFTRRDHSARQLLNSIAETSSYWIEDDEADRPVVEKMQLVVDRVVREYDDDVGVFSHLFDDLSRHLGSLQKKAEVAERRHVEAAKGKEKLELARAAAQEAVQQRLFDAKPPEAVKTLLENAWADALALSLLRLGVDNPKTRERLSLVDDLLAVFAEGVRPEEQEDRLEALRPCLEDGLSAVGFHGEAVAKVWSDISALIESASEQDQAAATHAITELIGKTPRLGGESVPAATATAAAGASASAGAEPGVGTSILRSLHKTERLPVGPKEQAMIERIRQLPFGTWFEFTMNQQGEKVRRKLCWFSPVTGRCLFLNARGVRAEEKMIDTLARDVLRGNAKVIDDTRESFIDRAWKGIMSVLKGAGIAGSPDAADKMGQT
ncbi:MAG: DUF1631 domain-containing protein [Xanthomonadales bacterium]|nr:DUF1631 domain-containing protein [Xanthomonadales bacterium]MCP5474189.1 DUF1631 domain-containing protein [Rhodanobacteraceae bacterium]